MNFDFSTLLCYEMLELMMDTNNEFFEQTQIDCIIDYVFQKNKTKLVIMNMIYILQAVFVSYWEFYPQNYWVKLTMYTLASIIIFIEMIQLTHDPWEYVTSPYNYLEILGNILVIVILSTTVFKHFTWVMILMVMLKAVLTLRISQAQRTLIQMIIECIIGMVPFLIIVAISVFSFALVNYSLDKEEGIDEGLFENLGNQYRILFGENPEIEFTYNKLVKWVLYVSFTLLMCTVMLNLLISIISDEYDRVQATEKSTDLKAKCDILYDYGQLEMFFNQKILRKKIEHGEPMYVHRFIHAAAAGNGGVAEGQWVGRVKVLTEKQEQLLDEIKEVKEQLVA